MSSNLVWEPVDKDYNHLDSDIKYALRHRYGNPVSAVLDSNDIPYLEGLIDAGNTKLKEVVKLIESHGEIKIEEVWL